MASWIIVATFVVTAIYLIIKDRNFSGLPLVSSIATALLMCFFGMLFSAATKALLAQVGWPIDNPLVLGGLIPFGVILGLLVRQRWKKS
ncbi:MAG: hypothetical protein V7707_09495 [Motiliproteus sp.]